MRISFVSKKRLAMQTTTYMVFGTKHKVEILPTKFERKVGDKINGQPIIAILNGDAEKQMFIKAWNHRINQLRNIRRKQQRHEDAIVWANMMKQSPALMQAVQNYLEAVIIDSKC